MPDPTPRQPASPSLPANAVAPLDAIQRAMALASARVIAITSPRSGIATDTISTMLCTSIAASETKTLLIDASKAHSPTAPSRAEWVPGEPLPDAAIEKNAGNAGYDLCAITTTATSRPLFNNLARLQKTLQQDLRSYGAVVINLPPVLDSGSDVVNPVSVARAVDTAFLVCATGRTTASDAQSAASTLVNANVTLAGTILDNTDMDLPGPQIAEYIENTRLLPGGLRRRLAHFLRTSHLFND